MVEGPLFPGDALPLPVSHRAGDWTIPFPFPPPVVHAAGYEQFARYLIRTGLDPHDLADQPLTVATFIATHRQDLQDIAGLRASAVIFLGNTLTRRVETGRWHVRDEQPLVVQQLPDLPARIRVHEIVTALLAGAPDRINGLEQQLITWDGAAAMQADTQARLALPAPTAPPEPYPFRAAEDRPSQSDLVGTADRLAAYLLAVYTVTAIGTRPLPDDPVPTHGVTVRTIRITPAAGDAAPLILAIDSYGAVLVRAGVLTDFSFFGQSASELEDTVLAVTAGAFREAYPLHRGQQALHGWALGHPTDPAGTSSSSIGPTQFFSTTRLEAAALLLDQLPNGWQAWPPRTRPQYPAEPPELRSN